MTTQVPTALRTFAFGDLETGIWGVAAEWDTTSIASFAGLFETALGAGAPAILSGAGP